MILTKNKIEKFVKNNQIYIENFDKCNLNPNSYNYHLNDILLESTSQIIDARKPTHFKEIKLKKEGYVLNPNKLYLGNTYEKFGSDDFVITLMGRSSLGRLGLFLQVTADLGNLGAKHAWTLELKVVQPLRIYPMMKIGQIVFWSVSGMREHFYEGKYGRYSTPHYSEIYKENF